MQVEWKHLHLQYSLLVACWRTHTCIARAPHSKQWNPYCLEYKVPHDHLCLQTVICAGINLTLTAYKLPVIYTGHIAENKACYFWPDSTCLFLRVYFTCLGNSNCHLMSDFCGRNQGLKLIFAAESEPDPDPKANVHILMWSWMSVVHFLIEKPTERVGDLVFPNPWFSSRYFHDTFPSNCFHWCFITSKWTFFPSTLLCVSRKVGFVFQGRTFMSADTKGS